MPLAEGCYRVRQDVAIVAIKHLCTGLTRGCNRNLRVSCRSLDLPEEPRWKFGDNDCVVTVIDGHPLCWDGDVVTPNVDNVPDI